jgi:hypothetical protein
MEFWFAESGRVKIMTRPVRMACQNQDGFFFFSIRFMILLGYTNISLGTLVANKPSKGS